MLIENKGSLRPRSASRPLVNDVVVTSGCGYVTTTDGVVVVGVVVVVVVGAVVVVVVDTVVEVVVVDGVVVGGGTVVDGGVDSVAFLRILTTGRSLLSTRILGIPCRSLFMFLFRNCSPKGYDFVGSFGTTGFFRLVTCVLVCSGSGICLGSIFVDCTGCSWNSLISTFKKWLSTVLGLFTICCTCCGLFLFTGGGVVDAITVGLMVVFPSEL